MAKEIRQIGVLTSGGDSPGMNAAIRAVAREAMYNKCKVIGIQRGYKGLLNEEFKEMKSIDVAGIIHQGQRAVFRQGGLNYLYILLFSKSIEV
jgi:6-phosphofructokinase 1